MKSLFLRMLTALLLLGCAHAVTAQERRPIDNQHPLWFIHVDVWNSADPQKIIDLIPDAVKPYVCMNLSLSCQFDTATGMYRMPRNAVRTYKSWASVCQQNGLWFSCQPASGGHTHIQDDDLETFEYFFKTYPNFLGWNYAEQFWGFDVGGDMSSSSQASRLALFAKLVPMHHKYGGFLTISFCGNIWSHGLNPMGMMKRNKDLLQACKDYPEACLWLYKYTTSSCWYNNESVTFGPFISGLAKNYGVRYDNCGYNGALDAILGDGHGKKYPGAAGIGTVMEQTCVNGGAVWDGPELIWTEDFQNLSNTNVDGYTRRNWGTFPNFRGIWLDMFRRIIDGTLYIPSREEVVGKTRIVVQNDVNSGNDEQKYAAWGDLYNGLYKQDDPFNRGNGQWMDNFCYFKKSGRYGAIPFVIALYDDIAKKIPITVKKSAYTSRWGSQTAKVNDFNKEYPEVSKGDLYVNRYRNQLITYTPYTYLNKKKSAEAVIPLQYNTCDTLKLTYGKLSAGSIREYEDHIDFYLNNYRSDSTTQQTDVITVTGVAQQPSYTRRQPSTSASGHNSSVTATYDSIAATYTLNVRHMGPVLVTVNCSGNATERLTDVLPAEALPLPKQPEPFNGTIIIEAENMDYKSVKNVALTHSGWWAQDYNEFSAMGFVEMGSNTSAALRHQLKLNEGGDYDIYVRYCNTSKAANLRVTVNNTPTEVPLEKVGKSEWRKAKVSATLIAGTNNLVIVNTGGAAPVIDQIIYMPVGTPTEKFLVTVRNSEQGTVTPNVTEAAEGETVTLAIEPADGYQLKQLRYVNSVYFTMGKVINVPEGATEVSFVMPDDNVTLQPIFGIDTQSEGSGYVLDYTTVGNGSIPEGWRATDGTDVHQYPNSYGSGARTMVGFSGYQQKALYWRNTSADYGRQTAFPLHLQAGDYQFAWVMAAWKETPSYKAQIVNATTNAALVTSASITAKPNANGSTTADLSSAVRNTLDFTVAQEGNYVIEFTTSGGYNEFLLLDCRIKMVDNPQGINDAWHAPQLLTTEVHNLLGVKQQNLKPGLNIIRTPDGKTKKVFIK